MREINYEYDPYCSEFLNLPDILFSFLSSILQIFYPPQNKHFLYVILPVMTPADSCNPLKGNLFAWPEVADPLYHLHTECPLNFFPQYPSTFS